MKYNTRQKLSALGLPFGVLIIIPSLILWLTNDFSLGWNLPPIFNTPLLILGFAILLSGLTLLAVTIRMFSKIGKGTLAPWAPPESLVVEGLYSRTRSPMISGVLIVLLGESIIFSSVWVFALFLIFLVGNHIYFIKSEEPGLLTRFGDEYQKYKANVPRWLPRRTPWKPDYESEDS
jgi:protein-S-isoprenylcysteine O-methyltransferase Ste14